VFHLERYAEYLTAAYGHDRLPGGAPGRVRLAGLSRSKIGFSSAEGLRGRLPGTEAGRFGMGPAVVPVKTSLRFPCLCAAVRRQIWQRVTGSWVTVTRGSGGNVKGSSSLMMPAPPQ
jgi:hypothetical protein